MSELDQSVEAGCANETITRRGVITQGCKTRTARVSVAPRGIFENKTPQIRLESVCPPAPWRHQDADAIVGLAVVSFRTVGTRRKEGASLPWNGPGAIAGRQCRATKRDQCAGPGTNSSPRPHPRDSRRDCGGVENPLESLAVHDPPHLDRCGAVDAVRLRRRTTDRADQPVPYPSSFTIAAIASSGDWRDRDAGGRR